MIEVLFDFYYVDVLSKWDFYVKCEFIVKGDNVIWNFYVVMFNFGYIV